MIKRNQLQENDARNPQYVIGFLTQSGSNAPVLSVLLDDISPVFSRSAAGDYLATKAGAFTENKTVPNAVGEIYQDGSGNCFQAVWVSANAVRFLSATSSTVDAETGLLTDLADDLFTGQKVQITVFA